MHISKAVELTPHIRCMGATRTKGPLLRLERFLTQLDSRKSHAQDALAKLRRDWNLRRDDEIRSRRKDLPGRNQGKNFPQRDEDPL